VTEVSFQVLANVAPKVGLEFLHQNVTSREEIEHTLKALPKGGVDAICLVPSSLVVTHLDLLIQIAKEDKIPLAVHEGSIVEKGALVSYGAGFRQLGLQAAKLIGQVLQEAKPAEIPIQTPERMVLAINLTPARATGLKIPRSILERADHLVE
jgi:putative tryptophan/tyrosine transport system substrate-binding protein